ncbi:MAG: hypothetical protein QE271_10080 [Bacteriovoracaceae bacterium]|nr:hypothetical protein [Bacteriovoracaceae bacterium]
MYQNYFQSKEFFEFLFKTDQDLAQQTKDKNCPHCNAPVHIANYMRKPRGIKDLPNDLSLCFSFCCSREGCRRRAMPGSTRFMGRFVYWSIYIILISAMLNGRATELKKIAVKFDIDLVTLKRWRGWWKDFFPTTKFWKELKGKFLGEIEILPNDLLAAIRINNPKEDYIIIFLRLLSTSKKANLVMANIFTQ